MRVTAQERTDFDLLIVGAGPSGLSLAAAITDADLRIAVIERQSLGTLRDPAFDGREIALTHASVGVLRQIGAWQHIDPSEVSPVRDVRVLNGTSRHGMYIDHADGGADQLGCLVSNHLIRRAAYHAATDRGRIALLTERHVADVRGEGEGMRVILADGSSIRASLIVAADSRFSDVRRRLGISARMRDFGKTMLVCRMHHEQPHRNTAWEWFDYGQTLALLPLRGNRSSVVITVSGSEACRLQGLSPAEFGVEVRERFRGRVGDMRLISPVFAYPLVAVMPDTFVARRCALVGDAAVGMHPVTAHGFNLGLLGAARLANLIDSAAVNGQDIGSPGVLASYERAHRRATVPLYLATNAIAGLYTDERLPVRVLRHALVRFGNGMAPFRRAIAASLTRPLS